jgi:hypothetical protein
MTEPTDLAALLRALAGQNEALLAAHAESLRLQRLVLERLLEPAPAAAPPARPAAPSAVAPSGIAPAAPPADTAPPPATATPPIGSPEPAREPPPEASDPGPVSTARPRLRVVPPAANPDSSEPPERRLAALHRLAPAGEAGLLVLTFGAHKGETLADVARSDPDYLRWLAAKAHRGDVRAAARKLLVLLAQGNRQPPASGLGR